MKRILILCCAAALACSHNHVDTTTTTSAPLGPNVDRPSSLPWSPSPQTGSSQMPFDLPSDIMLDRDAAPR
jgi:hypothetical protein